MCWQAPHRHIPGTGRSLTKGRGGADAAGGAPHRTLVSKGAGVHAAELREVRKVVEHGEVGNVLEHAVERGGESQSGQNAAAGKGGYAPAEPGGSLPP